MRLLSVSRTDSVISSSSRQPAIPASASAARTVSMRSAALNWWTERLTETRTSAGHSAACRQAARSTYAPSGTMSPVSSASGMNSPGETTPRSGWRQRTSASKLRIVRLRASSSGW